MSASDALAILALIIASVAAWFARRSALAAEASAKTTQDALAHQKQTDFASRTQAREQRLSTLAKEALDAWGTHGSLTPILDRESDLLPEDQYDLALRVYRVRSGPNDDPEQRARRAIEQWRNAHAKP